MWHRLVKKLIETCIQSWEFCTAKFSAIEVEQVRLHHTAKDLQEVSDRVFIRRVPLVNVPSQTHAKHTGAQITLWQSVT